MPSRSEELRRRDRKVFAWAMAVAVGAHLALFAGSVTIRTIFFEADDLSVDRGAGFEGRAVYVALRFGPPAITAHDGTIRIEPADRFLEADRLVPLDPECAELVEVGGVLPLHGRVRLIVGGSGRASVAQITRGTGHECTDEVIRQVAEALRYHWLPSAEYPNPVDLEQPVTVTRADE